MSRTRLFATVVAIAACTGLVMQFIDTSADRPTESAAEVIWRMMRYFTILTNALVAASFARIALTGRSFGAVWMGGLALWIGIVAVVYHLLLGRDLSGFALVADHMVHTVTPALTVLYWLVAAPKSGLRLGAAGQWILWPLIYVVYALARGALDGIYPYFFVDPTRDGGWLHVLQWSAMLCGAFYLAGVAQVLVARVLR